MTALLLTLALATPAPFTYHPIRVDEFATRKLTHVCTTGLVAMKKREDDRDWHYRIVSDAPATAGFIVAEVTEQTQLPAPFNPRVGDRVEVCGTRRYDDAPGHGWFEVHPVERARVLPKAQP
jgi:hypothetical protein